MARKYKVPFCLWFTRFFFQDFTTILDFIPLHCVKYLTFTIAKKHIQSVQISLDPLCREPIKINDNRHNYEFIRGTIKYVTCVMS